VRPRFGFTGATGGQFAVQQISNFSYTQQHHTRSTFSNNIAVTTVPATIEVGVPVAGFNSMTVTPAGTVSIAPSASRANAACRFEHEPGDYDQCKHDPRCGQ
jgi:hypothetical protein